MGVKQCEPSFLIGNLKHSLFKTKSHAEFIMDCYNKYPNSR